MSDGVVVVGAGQAGLQVAASLREQGFGKPITLIGDESVLPYQRPPLSKAYLLGKVQRDGLWLRPADFLAQHAITHMAGVRVVGIDRGAREVLLGGGDAVPYEHLVLATGSRNRTLPIPGVDAEGVHQLRSLDDADGLSRAIEDAKHVVIVGAGFIGLEVAAVCAAMGREITVLEAADRVMARAVSPQTSAWFSTAHEAAGIRIRFEAAVTAIESADGHVTSVRLGSGERVRADLVLVGIGVVANDEIARDAGLSVRDGIEVDTFLLTHDPAISAIGDCVRCPTPFGSGITRDGRVRIESVQNALDQARCVAARLVGRARAYDAVPWFWSDQGPHKLQIAGLATPGDDSVRRGEPDAFSVFRFRNGALSAVESINRPGDHMAARRILVSHLPLSADQVAADTFDLRRLAKAAA